MILPGFIESFLHFPSKLNKIPTLSKKKSTLPLQSFGSFPFALLSIQIISMGSVI